MIRRALLLPSFLTWVFARQVFFKAPCVPDGRVRVLRLYALDQIRKLEERCGPLSVLNHLGLCSSSRFLPEG